MAITTSKQTARPLFFIASYPRSGNTWVRAFLLSLLHEAGLLPPGKDGLKDMEDLLPWDIRARYVVPLLGKSPKEATLPEFAHARTLVHRWFSEHFPGPPIIKTHALFGTVHGYETIPSRAYFGACYLVRNPLDVAPSLARMMDYPVGRAIKTMNTPLYVTGAHEGAAPEPWGDWSYNIHSWTEVGPPRVLVLRYEDLRTDPFAQFQRLAQHIGIGATPQQVRGATEAVRIERLEAFEGTADFKSPAQHAKRFFGSGLRESYTEKLTAAEARAIIEAHAIRMEKFGYLDDQALEFAGISRQQALAAGRNFRA